MVLGVLLVIVDFYCVCVVFCVNFLMTKKLLSGVCGGWVWGSVGLGVEVVVASLTVIKGPDV